MDAESGRYERASCLLGTAGRLRDELLISVGAVFREQHDRTVGAILDRIGRRAFDAAFAQGRAMKVSEGVAFASQDKRPERRPAPDITTEPRTVLTRRELQIAQLAADTSATSRSQPGSSCPSAPSRPTSPTSSTSSALTQGSSSAAG